MGNSSSTNDFRPQVPDNWNATNIPSQKGKIAIITGANSGIGYETALELARKGANVILACRNDVKGKHAEAMLRENLVSTPDSGSVEFMILDVSDLGSVNKFTDKFKATHDRLDLLINNAGVMAIPYTETVNGYERQFATNHLGHFALTAQLFPLLKETTSSRVVNISSIAHNNASIDQFKASSGIMHTSEKSYSPIEAYAESRLSNLLFTVELDRRLRDRGMTTITSVACHPGLASTNLSAAPSAENKGITGLLWRISAMLPLSQDASMGALPTLYAATGNDVEGGDYYGPGNFCGCWGPPKRVQPQSTAHDEESERLARLKFAVE